MAGWLLGAAWIMNLFWAPPLGLPLDLDVSLVGGNALAPVPWQTTQVMLVGSLIEAFLPL